jgi:hypothetical protein
MIEAIAENKSTFTEDFLHQLSIVGKILVKPIPSTFRGILEYPNIRMTATVVLLVIARLGVNTIALIQGNEFFDESTVAIPVYLLLLAYTTGSMCKDFFRGQKHLFKQFFLALVAIYFASLFINGVLTSLMLVFDNFREWAPRLVLVYQFILTVIAVHAIADLNLWKSTFAVMIGHVVAGLGFVLIGPIIGMIFYLW